MISPLQEVVPQLWVAKLSAVMPGTGLPINWHGLWMEEARGITLYGLQTSGGLALSLSLLQQKLNRTQVPAPCTCIPLCGGVCPPAVPVWWCPAQAQHVVWPYCRCMVWPPAPAAPVWWCLLLSWCPALLFC